MENSTQEPDSGSPPTNDSQPLVELNRLLGEGERIDLARLDELFVRFQEANPSSSELDPLRERIEQVKNQQRERDLYEKTRQECLALWNQEQEFLLKRVSADAILSQLFRAAIQKVDTAIKLFSPPYVPILLEGLLTEASTQLNIARRKYEALPTADQIGGYKELIEYLALLNPDELFPWEDKAVGTLESLKRDEAIRRTQIRAENYANKKVQEYIASAETYLENHDPRAALTAIKKGEALFALGDTDRAFLGNFSKNSILPMLANLERAEKQASLAKTSIDPRAGWELLEEAFRLFPWSPAFLIVRNDLVSKIFAKTNSHNEKAEKHFEVYQKTEQVEVLEAARADSKQALELLEIVREYMAGEQAQEHEVKFKTLLDRVNQNIERGEVAKKETDDLAQLAAQLEGKLKAKDKTIESKWKVAEEKFGTDKLKANERLREIRFRMDQVSGAEAVAETIEETFASGNAVRLEEANANCEKALKNFTDPNSREILESLRQKIQIRLKYLAALEKFEKGEVDKALLSFKEVARYSEHPDAFGATEKINQISQADEHLTSMERALSQAKTKMESAPRLAHEVLKSVSQYKTIHTKNVLDLLEKARNSWEKKGTAELERVLSSKNPGPQKILALTKELAEDLPPPRPIELIENASAEAYALEGRAFAKVGNWKDAEGAWRNAMRHNSSRDDIRQGLQEARIKQTEETFERDPDGFQQAQLDAIVSEFSSNPQVWILKAKYEAYRGSKLALTAKQRIEHITRAQNDLKLARNALDAQWSELTTAVKQPRKKTDEVFQANVASREKTLTSVGKVLEKLEKEIRSNYELANAQNSIEQKVAPNRGKSDYERAKVEAQKLIERSGSESGVVASWWEDLIQKTTRELTKLIEQEGEPNQKTFELVFKVLTLDPTNARANQLRNKLPQFIAKLKTVIDSQINDKNGLQIDGGNELRIAELQLQYHLRLRDSVLEAQSWLKDAGESSARQTLLEQSMPAQEAFIEGLSKLVQQTKQAEQFLSQAKIGGHWENFDALMLKMNSSGYGDHRTVLGLFQEQDFIKRRRQALQAAINEIVALCEDENGRGLEQAIEKIRIYTTDPNQGDQLDEYGFWASLQITPPSLNEIEVGPVRDGLLVSAWVREQREQISKMVTWLVYCGQRDLLVESNVVMHGDEPRTPQGVVQWKTASSEVERFIDRGNYPTASERLNLSLNGVKGSEWAHTNERLLPLHTAYKRLQEVPYSKTELTNRFSAFLANEAKKKEGELKGFLQEAKELENKIRTNKRKWEDASEELNEALNELQRLKGNLLLQRLNKGAIQSAKRKASVAIAECRKIAPRYPDLEELENSIADG